MRGRKESDTKEDRKISPKAGFIYFMEENVLIAQ